MGGLQSLKPDSATTCSIALRASVLTEPLLFKARETVAMDTPARRATSLIVSDFSTMDRVQTFPQLFFKHFLENSGRLLVSALSLPIDFL